MSSGMSSRRSRSGGSQAQHVEAEVEIAAEGALGHGLFEITVGGGQDAHVDGNAAGAADGRISFS